MNNKPNEQTCKNILKTLCPLNIFVTSILIFSEMNIAFPLIVALTCSY